MSRRHQHYIEGRRLCSLPTLLERERNLSLCSGVADAVVQLGASQRTGCSCDSHCGKPARHVVQIKKGGEQPGREEQSSADI